MKLLIISLAWPALLYFQPGHAVEIQAGTYQRAGSTGPICLNTHSPQTIAVTRETGIIPSLKQNTPWLNSADMKIAPLRKIKAERGLQERNAQDSEIFLAQLGVQKQSHIIKVMKIDDETFAVSFFSTRTDGTGKEVGDVDSRKEICTVEYELAAQLKTEGGQAQIPVAQNNPATDPDLPILLLTNRCITDGKRLKLSKDVNVVIADQVRTEGAGIRGTHAGSHDDTIFVSNEGDNCTINLRMDRFKFLAANVAMYSSGWAQASGDRELCSALYHKLEAKLHGPTPGLVISLNDNRQSFANFVGGRSTIHDLQLLQICEIE